MTSRSLPCAICSTCGHYGYDPGMIDAPCKLSAGTARGCSGNRDCDGHWLKRDRFTDWYSCTTCGGSGYHRDKRCSACRNSGWVPAR